MGDFDVMTDLSQLLPKFDGKSLEWETLKTHWRSCEEIPILLDSISLTLKAIKIEMGPLSPKFKVIAEQFTHPIELMMEPADNLIFEKSCPLETNIPFIRADEMAAMSDVDGGKFVMTTTKFGSWADKVYQDPEFADAGIPFSPFVIGYAKKIGVKLKGITVTVEEEEIDSIKTMNRSLTVNWTMSINIRPIFGDYKTIIDRSIDIPMKETKNDLEDWIDRVDEAVQLCACEVAKYAWSSVAGAAVPIPGTSVFVDIAVCAKMSLRFKTIFKETIKIDDIISDLKTRFDYIPEEILVSNVRFLTIYIVEREAELIGENYLHKLVLQHVGNHTLKTASHWVPFLGVIVATSLAYPFMRHTGFQVISEYEKSYTDGFKKLHAKLMAFSND